jgi:hypothetical protein
MISLSFVSQPHWPLSISINNFLGIESFIFAQVSLTPLLLLSLSISKALSKPFARIENTSAKSFLHFKKLKKDLLYQQKNALRLPKFKPKVAISFKSQTTIPPGRHLQPC